MEWMPVDMTTPEKWYRSKCWRWGNTAWIVAVAFCPTHFSLGGELLTGYGKGFALCLGPFWLGTAVSLPTPPETNDG